MANLNPTPPSAIEVGNVAETPGMATGSTGSLSITAELNDPDGDDVRMMVRLSPDHKFNSYVDRYSAFVNTGTRAEVHLHGLKQNVHYYARVYARDKKGAWARQSFAPHHIQFTSVDFWTNRPPTPAVLVTPAENANIAVGTDITFDWTRTDPDPGDVQADWQLRYRVAATAVRPPGKWTLESGTGPDTDTTVLAGPFKSGRDYEWQVRTSDGHMWSVWSDIHSFYSLGVSVPPVLRYPINDVAVDTATDPVLTWRFRGYATGDSQLRADLRYRLVGQDDSDWITLLGANDPGNPGTTQAWETTGEFVAGFHWEWQIRTYGDVSGLASDWSESETFRAITTPGQAAVDFPAVPFSVVQGSLGCGSYRVFVYGQGGQTILGEVEPVSTLTFGRKRDDISSCIVDTNGFSIDCCDLYANLRSWAHELVVFRDGVRVWEGPITRISYMTGSVEIEAKDVMAYLYRRIMRQGFNDSYQVIDGTQQGLRSVVERAQIILVNALAGRDPNLLPYLTAYTYDDDARQSRIVPDYSQTAWEQVDDLAANAGLDYTVVGRRIMLWDTHRAIGRLPEMRDGDFDSPPVVTEYGMQMCNYSAVTNGSGIWGAATPLPLEGQDSDIYFGPVEMLNSAFNESSAAVADALTPAARSALIRTLESQAQRNINNRWPNPVVVRVPDNSTLSPNVGVTFDQLVPGVWIPLRSTGTCRQVVQWQKLDSVTVTETNQGERVAVVMSPAPNGGVDPDSGEGVGDEGGGES